MSKDGIPDYNVNPRQKHNWARRIAKKMLVEMREAAAISKGPGAKEYKIDHRREKDFVETCISIVMNRK